MKLKEKPEQTESRRPSTARYWVAEGLTRLLFARTEASLPFKVAVRDRVERAEAREVAKGFAGLSNDLMKQALPKAKASRHSVRIAHGEAMDAEGRTTALVVVEDMWPGKKDHEEVSSRVPGISMYTPRGAQEEDDVSYNVFCTAYYPLDGSRGVKIVRTAGTILPGNVYKADTAIDMGPPDLMDSAGLEALQTNLADVDWGRR